MIDYDRIRDFYDRHRAQEAEAARDEDFLRGTVERSRGIARFRNRAEARHLGKVLAVEPGSAVLDLGGGTGRWSLFFARRGARVTMVELAPSLAEGARANAAAEGLSIDVRVGSLLAPPLAAQEQFDLLHIGGVLVYINDADLPRVREVLRAHARSGARLVVREPVDPNGPSELQEPGGYAALFRRPESYVNLFAPDWQLCYERTTVSHLVPRGRDTRAVVSGLQSAAWKRALIDVGLPLVGYVDYELLGVESWLRRSRLQGLLGDPGVVQRFMIFSRR